jgi:hypothetical protein
MRLKEILIDRFTNSFQNISYIRIHVFLTGYIIILYYNKITF